MNIFKSILLKSFTILCFVLASYCSGNTAPCSNGIEKDNLCHFIPKSDNGEFERLTWQGAQTYCEEHGAQLMDILSMEDQRFLHSMAERYQVVENELWIGLLKDSERGGDWKWNGDRVINFDNWGPYQGKVTGDACVYSLREAPAEQGPFQIYEGYTLLHINNDYSQVTFSSLPNTTETLKFGFYTLENCQKEVVENNYTLFTLLKGISNGQFEANVCFGIKSRLPALEPLSQAITGIHKDLSSVNHGCWFTSKCNEAKKPFICKANVPTTVTTPPTTTTADNSAYECPDGYFEIINGQKCFKLVTVQTAEEGLSWEDARAMCQKGPGRNPDLANIHSTAETATIASQLDEYVMGSWIGYHSESYGVWEWTDRSNANYTNWSDMVQYKGTGCAEFLKSHGNPGAWNILQCNQKRGYFCETYKEPGTKSNPDSGYCHDGWVPYKHSCYQLMTTEKVWEEAEKMCTSLQTPIQAHVASVHSDAENAFLLALSDNSPSLWTGMAKQVGGEYKWSDSWPVSFTKWANEGIEKTGKCVYMSKEGLWNDDICRSKRRFICKYTSDEQPTIPTKTEGICPNDKWYQWGMNCYYFWVPIQEEKPKYTYRYQGNDEYKFDWLEAQSICRSMVAEEFKSNLVSIHNSYENTMIVKKLKEKMINLYGETTVWIGLHRNGTESDFEYQDQSVVQYVPWSPGEPNSPELETQCVELRVDTWEGAWNDDPCENKNFFVCEAEMVDPSNIKLPEANVMCPNNDWVKKDKSCYYFQLYDLRTWDHANQKCGNLTGGEGHLVTLNSKEDNKFIQAHIFQKNNSVSNLAFWIGLHKKGPIKENPYMWIDGSVRKYQNWALNEPNDINGDENCVEYKMPSGQWNDHSCEEERGYVCVTPIKQPQVRVNSQQKTETGSKHGMIGGSLGIVITVILVIIIVVVIAVVYIRRKRRNKKFSKFKDDYSNVVLYENNDGEC